MPFTDDDVKIYTGDEEAAVQGEGERSAAAFVAHKENGNLERTRRLGEAMAQTLADAERRLAGVPYAQHKLALISFLAVDELEAEIPDLLLQKSAAAAYNRRIEELSSQLAAIVSDATAYTFLILNDRRREGKTEGQVLAQLCDEDDNAALIREGDALAREYRECFAEMIRGCRFV